MASISTRNKKSGINRESFFRLEAMKSPYTPSLDIELVAQPLSLKLISVILTAMLLVAFAYMNIVNYTSTHFARGSVFQAGDGSTQFVATALPHITQFLEIGDLAEVHLDGFPSNSFGPIRGTIMSINANQHDMPEYSGVSIVLELVYPEVPGTKIPLRAGLSGQVKLTLESKSLMDWITQYVWTHLEL